jgi:hypothetical protein
MLRSAGIHPVRLSRGESSGKAEKGSDWLNDPEWFISHDIVGGEILDYTKWHKLRPHLDGSEEVNSFFLLLFNISLFLC